MGPPAAAPVTTREWLCLLHLRDITIPSLRAVGGGSGNFRLSFWCGRIDIGAGRFTLPLPMATTPKPLPLVPLLILGTVGYLIVRHPQTGFLGWFFRALLTFVAVVWLGWWWLTRNIATDPSDAADEIVRMQKALYSEPHEFRVVRAADFRDVDIDFYDRTRQFFESQGFRFLGDIEDVTATKEFPQMRTFLRVMAGDDGATQLAIYHLKMRGFFRLLQLIGVLPRNVKQIDLETEMSDGSFVVTANAEGVDTTGAVPRVHRFLHPRDTPAADLLRLHREQVEQATRRDPALQPVRVRTLDHLIQAQHRLQAMKNAHKASFGYMDAKELRQIAGEDSDAVRDLAAEFDRRKR